MMKTRTLKLYQIDRFMTMNDCPVRRTLDLIGGKWTLLIVYKVDSGITRYGALRRSIPEISEKMLMHELKELVSSGLISRQLHETVPPKVEYTLTPKGRKLLPLITVLFQLDEDLRTASS